MRQQIGWTAVVGLVVSISGCGGASHSPEEAIREFIQDEMLITKGKYMGVNKGEVFGEFVQWYEPKTVPADLHVSACLGSPVAEPTRTRTATIPKGVKAYRAVFTSKWTGGEYDAKDANRCAEWADQNPLHARRFLQFVRPHVPAPGMPSEAVFYVDKNRVQWVSLVDFWDHESGMKEIVGGGAKIRLTMITEKHTY